MRIFLSCLVAGAVACGSVAVAVAQETTPNAAAPDTAAPSEAASPDAAARTDITGRPALGAVAVPSGDGGMPEVMSHVLRRKQEGALVHAGEAGGTRIYGGRPAEPDAWPAQVGIVAKEKIGDTEESLALAQFCGGSLIARQWVLTAAHCVVNDEGKVIETGEIVVRTGSSRLTAGDIREVAQIYSHEAYDPAQLVNDIALIKLVEPIGQSSGPVGAIRVAQQDEPVEQTSGVVVGWGLMEDGRIPIELLETDVDIVSDATCNQALANLNARELGAMLLGLGSTSKIPMEKLEEAYQILVQNMGEPLEPGQICAGTASGESDSCNGDSGGPLMVKAADGSWTQIGIVSAGRKPMGSDSACGNPEIYSLYTRLGDYYDWIAAHVQGGS